MELVINQGIDEDARRDILELDQKIRAFQEGKIDSEKFRAYRLTRGVYGQRQDGVNMIRIKLPFGKVTPEQLIRIANLSDKYASGNLHATTRQDIQLHYVKITDAPALWAALEEKKITLREACGNTIRNMTASAIAGIDPKELFDVSPYVNAMFNFFLRNPICQELGRKFKIAFSSSEGDSAFTFIHDLGFIPKLTTSDGVEQRGFKVVLGGGLGAQPFHAHPIFDFLPEDQVIPFSEAVIRVFDRYGERAKRHKARLKYLINDIGLAKFLELVEKEKTAIHSQSVKIDLNDFEKTTIPDEKSYRTEEPLNQLKYSQWVTTNVFEQKQAGFFAVQLRFTNGDLSSERARKLARIVQEFAADDIRITVNQGMVLKYVRPSALPSLFNALDQLHLAEPGFDSTHDITACPGTDTCNLGIASSMGLSKELERILKFEFQDLIFEKGIKIKISGCMNACAQHTIANIGLHGMSLKVGKLILPAMQVLLGGGILGNGEGSIAEKVIKLPSKRIPEGIRALLNDYKQECFDGEVFNDYFQRQGKNYFYNLLKPLSEIIEVVQDDLIDWGNEDQYKTLIGVGECAGSLVDMVTIVLDETREKLDKADEAYNKGAWVEAIYYSYNAYINAGKAFLLSKDLTCNTHISVLNNIGKYLEENTDLNYRGRFSENVLQINQNVPDKDFAFYYFIEAQAFFLSVLDYRNKQMVADNEGKE